MFTTTVKEAGSTATLSGAILLYAGTEVSEEDHYYATQSSLAHCTIHSVKPINGRPEVMPGRLLTQEDLQHLVSGITKAELKSLDAQWIQDSVLATGRDRKIWWTPPGERAMFFEYTADKSLAFKGHARCAVPGLVWMAMGLNDRQAKALYVYAFKGKDRPTQDSQLYQAPFFNVWGRGRVCIGSAQLPDDSRITCTEAWESTFFGSRFTHPNFIEKDRLLAGADPVKFWKSQLAKPAKRFNEKHLVTVPLKVGDLLESTLLDRLATWPKPRGEF